jgi:hypothetical protein
MIDANFNKNNTGEFDYNSFFENEIDHYYCYLKQDEIFEDRRNPFTEKE